MDVLLVVGPGPTPARLAVRTAHQVHADGAPLPADVIANLRSHIPRDIGVVGTADPEAAIAAAAQLHRAGLPVTLFVDGPVADGRLEGVRVLPATDRGEAMEVADSLLDLVGGTPLVRLDRIGRDLSCQLVAKLEMLNPGGSVKDRPAIAMIDAAERAGLLEPGGTIVEPTSGNTGAGLAIVAAQRGYRCIFVMSDNMSRDKRSLLRAYGSEVV